MNNTIFCTLGALPSGSLKSPSAVLGRFQRGSLTLAFILLAALGVCRGQDLTVTVSPATQTANRGDVVTFQGTIQNIGTTPLYLNGDSISWLLRGFPILPVTFDLHLDDRPFATGVPVKLEPGVAWTGNLFQVTVGLDAPATTYDGSLSVLGGSGAAPFTVLASGTFHLTVLGASPVAGPAAPGNLTATVAGSNVALAWTDQASNEEGFSIEQATDGGTYSVIALVGADREHYLVGPLDPAHVYFFRIRAFNGFATLTYSAFSTVVAAQVNVTAEATSAAGAVVNFAAAGVAGLTYSPNSGTAFPLGATPVTFSATDLDNNTGTGTFTVTVRDTTAPVVAAHADVMVEATSAAGAVATYSAGSATDAVTASPVITYSKNSGTVFPLGATPVTITAKDAANNAGTGTFSVVVQDTTAPVVAAHANVTVEATSANGAVVTYAAGSATDAVTASPAITYSQNSGTVFPIGVTTVTVTALDAAGNMDGVIFSVTVQDTTAPVVTPPANLTVPATSPAGALVTYPAATATDAVGVLSLTYSQNSGTTFPIGTTTVTATATDAANHAGTANFTVTVLPLTPVQNWRLAHFGTTSNTGTAADTADPYHTGIPNLFVFAFFDPNQDPAQAAVSQLPQAQRADGNLFYSFTEPVGISGITYGAEWQLTLQANNWQAITDTGTGTQHVFSVPIGSNPQLFIRLRVTNP